MIHSSLWNSACGTAEPTARVLEHFRRATGTCIDSEPEMLTLARRKLTLYSDRIEVREANIIGCDIPPCDVVFSAKTFHHVPPVDLPELFARIEDALRPGGCFILYDAMSVGPHWGASVRRQSSRFRQRHLQDAVASGIATQQEIDARVEYKRARLWCMDRYFWVSRLNKDRLLSRLGMTFFAKRLYAFSSKEPVMSNVSSAPSSVKPRCRRSKVVYRVRNWPDYDAGLTQRGSLTVWFSPQAVEAWYYQGPRQRGAQYTFSDVAIHTALTLRLMYHLPLRQTEGFVASIVALMGLAIRVPDHTTLSRRQADLTVALPTQPTDQTPAFGR